MESAAYMMQMERLVHSTNTNRISDMESTNCFHSVGRFKNKEYMRIKKS